MDFLLRLILLFIALAVFWGAFLWLMSRLGRFIYNSQKPSPIPRGRMTPRELMTDEPDVELCPTCGETPEDCTEAHHEPRD